MNIEYEKDYDDEVYEDEYYESNFEEEELADDDDQHPVSVEEEADDENDDSEGGEAWEEDSDKRVDISFACEECDYRWDDIYIKKKDVIDEDEEIEVVCPMCGTTNVTQI